MLITMFSDEIKIHFGWTVCTLYEVAQFLEAEGFECFRGFYAKARRCPITVRIRKCFHSWGRSKLGCLVYPLIHSCLNFKTTFIVPFRICIRYYLLYDQLSHYFKDRSIYLASAAEILLICKLAIMKLRRIFEEVWELLHVASIEIAENNGIEVTVKKRKEFLPKVTAEMSKEQWSENVQRSLKSIPHRQVAWVSIHS